MSYSVWGDGMFWAALFVIILFVGLVTYYACVIRQFEKHYNEVGWDKCPEPDPWEGINERPGFPG
jgi:hypothetical protein